MKRFTDSSSSEEPVSAAASCKFQEFHWSLNINGPQAAGVHPLVPLLIYSDRQFPPTQDSQPTAPQHDPRPDAPSRTRPCLHGDRAHRPAGAVKKPLNAFMLFMKETRAAVRQEVHERESAALNRILGSRWNALSEAEQSKYFALAQEERLLHRQLHPGWSARLNYGKRKRRQRATSQDGGLKTPSSGL